MALKTLRVKDVVGVDVRVRGDIDLNQTAPLLSLDFVGGGARLDRLAGYLGELAAALRQIGAARVRGRITGAAVAATLETALEGIGGLAKLTAPVDLTAGLYGVPGQSNEHPEVATGGPLDDAWPLAKRSVGPGRLAVRLTPRDDDRHDLRLLRAGEMTIALATMSRLRQLWPLDLADIRHPRALGLVRQVTENWWPRRGHRPARAWWAVQRRQYGVSSWRVDPDRRRLGPDRGDRLCRGRGRASTRN